MIAYPACYLADAKHHLGTTFDCAINEYGIDGDFFSQVFAQSLYGEQFALGNPWVVAGMSGAELAQRVIVEQVEQVPGTCSNWNTYPVPVPPVRWGASRQYWVGWALAHYQWASVRPFQQILEAVPFAQLEALYDIYHEADISLFLKDVDALVIAYVQDRPTQLHLRRVACGLSQSELAKAADVGLRSIQMYEQRVNDIDKAQAGTLFRIAKALGCSIEDLLEHPVSSCFEYGVVAL